MKPIDLADNNTEFFLIVIGLIFLAIVCRWFQYRERMAGKSVEQTIRQNPELDDE